MGRLQRRQLFLMFEEPGEEATTADTGDAAAGGSSGATAHAPTPAMAGGAAPLSAPVAGHDSAATSHGGCACDGAAGAHGTASLPPPPLPPAGYERVSPDGPPQRALLVSFDHRNRLRKRLPLQLLIAIEKIKRDDRRVALVFSAQGEGGGRAGCCRDVGVSFNRPCSAPLPQGRT
jgi:hypothetical protein